jgi:hypothetical protein
MIEQRPGGKKLGSGSDPGSLDSRPLPAVFLRLESPRERIALPYSCLLKLSLKIDESMLELSFVTHRVTVTGKNLAEIYKSIAEAEARVISVAASGFAEEAGLASYKSLVRGIQIEPLDADERRKR